MSTYVAQEARSPLRTWLVLAAMAALFVYEGLTVGWNTSLDMLRMGLVFGVAALGVNLCWGYAGLFNTGVVGFIGLGGLAVVLVTMPPTEGAWAAGGWGLVASFAIVGAVVVAMVLASRRLHGRGKALLLTALAVGGFFLYRALFDPAVEAIQKVSPAQFGYLGGLGLPTLIAWPVAGLLAAAAAWVIGKTALGLRSDYLAIATLGIGEIIIAVLRNEEWLARGVMNVVGIPRPWPVPREVEIQSHPTLLAWADWFGTDPVTASTLWVKILFIALFAAVLALLVWMAELALRSPWGRMMRAIRDNETASAAMGKHVTGRHMQVFVLGSALCGLAGAMMVSFLGQQTPTSYNPLDFTFMVWVMVIVGGSGNNLGAVVGGMLIWFLKVKAEVWGPGLMGLLTAWLPEGNTLRDHLLANAAHMRLMTMGLVLLLVLRFSPKGLLPAK